MLCFLAVLQHLFQGEFFLYVHVVMAWQYVCMHVSAYSAEDDSELRYKVH